LAQNHLFGDTSRNVGRSHRQTAKISLNGDFDIPS